MRSSEAFDGADVVVHLAFMITGTAARETIRAINVEGTLNAFAAPPRLGAKRFVYASSVAAYGFHADNPIGMTEDWPTRPAAGCSTPRRRPSSNGCCMSRPTRIPTSPCTCSARRSCSGRMRSEPRTRSPNRWRRSLSARSTWRDACRSRSPSRFPTCLCNSSTRSDVGQALLTCVLADGPPGAYNIAGDGIVTAADVVRELGFTPITVPGRIAQTAARAAALIPLPSFAPPAGEWVEAASHPAIMDTSKAKRELGWTPRHTALQALRDTLQPE